MREKIRFWVVGWALLFFVSAPGNYASANEVKSMLKSLLGNVIERAGDKVIENIQRPQKRVTSGQPVSGRQTRGGANDQWCHVWRNGRMTEHEACSASRKCKSSGVCYDTFVWPSGAKTVREVRGRKVLKINGARAKALRVLPDLVCVLNTRSGNAFCNTAGSYSDHLQAPAPTRTAKREPVIAEEEVPAQPTSEYTLLVDQYLNSVDGGLSDAQTKRSRCDMASNLVNDHADDISGDLLDLLSTQMEADECLG